MPTKKQAQSERTRSRLVSAATRLFAEKGYADTSVQAIGELAGISRGSIFWHFGSKEGLLRAVVESALADWESELVALLTRRLDEGSRGTSLRDLVFGYRDFMLENRPIGRLFYVLLFEALGPRPELIGAYRELYARFRRHGRAWADQASQDGHLPPAIDPEVAATVVTSAFTGLHLQWQLDPDAISLDRACEGLVAILERALVNSNR